MASTWRSYEFEISLLLFPNNLPQKIVLAFTSYSLKDGLFSFPIFTQDLPLFNMYNNLEDSSEAMNTEYRQTCSSYKNSIKEGNSTRVTLRTTKKWTTNCPGDQVQKNRWNNSWRNQFWHICKGRCPDQDTKSPDGFFKCHFFKFSAKKY